MIVSLDELKAVLGIELSDASQDAYLTRLILAKSAWVEGYTQRRFDTPIPHVQIEKSIGESELYLDWHVDDATYSPPITPTPDPPLPADSIVVSRRPVFERARPWEVLIEDEDWEREGDVLYFLRMWEVWPIEDEIKVEYLGGYYRAPEDIKEVILAMASGQYLLDTTVSSGTSGVTSEKIGDYSYSADLGNTTTTATGTDVVSDTHMKTLNRYKPRLV